jgi:hypothetical protein
MKIDKPKIDIIESESGTINFGTNNVHISGVATFLQGEFTKPTGTAPFSVISTTVVTNLNADTVDGTHASSFEPTLTKGLISASSPIVINDATRQVIGGAIAFSHASTNGSIHLPLSGTTNQILKNSGTEGTASWGTVTENAGALSNITTMTVSGQIINNLPTGTAPLAVASTTLNTSLNADLLDGQHSSYFSASTHDHGFDTENTKVGTGALYSNSTSSGNTAYGFDSIYSNTTGCYNTAVGVCSLYSNQTSCYNTAIGYQSLYTTTCAPNTMIGYQTGKCNTTGCYNTAIGYISSFCNCTACYNVAIGDCTLNKNTCGYHVAIGYGALCNNTTGIGNNAIGYLSMTGTVTGCYNVAYGNNSLKCVTSGCYNTASGNSAGICNTSACYNTAFGANSLSTNCTGCYNTAIGYQALCKATCCYNTAIGSCSSACVSTGCGNSTVGYCSSCKVTSGCYNSSLGYQSFAQGTTGCYNIAIGGNSLYTSATCSGNTAIGHCSLYTTTCGYHTALGFASGACITTGECNITIGCCSGSNLTTSTNAIVIGNIAGANNSNAVYIDNIYGSTCSSYPNVYVDTNDRLFVGGGINDQPEKTTLVDADVVLLEDSETTYIKRKVLTSTLKTEIRENIQYHNFIVNPDGEIAQRGASGAAVFTNTSNTVNNDDTYLFDRWNHLSDGNDVTDVSQISAGLAGSNLCMKYEVETQNKKFGFIQILESSDSIKLAGKYVNISFKAKTVTDKIINNLRASVLSWSGTADAVTSDVISAWGNSGTNPTLVANWTAENTASNFALTTSWTHYQISNIYIDTASMSNVALFIWVDDTDCSVNDLLYICQIEMILSDGINTDTWTYVPRPFEEELDFCKRFYRKTYLVSIAPGTASDIGTIQGLTASVSFFYDYTHYFDVEMRVTPTQYAYNPVTGAGGTTTGGLTGCCRNRTDGNDNTQLGEIYNGPKSTAFWEFGTLTAGKEYYFHITSDAEL